MYRMQKLAVAILGDMPFGDGMALAPFHCCPEEAESRPLSLSLSLSVAVLELKAAARLVVGGLVTVIDGFVAPPAAPPPPPPPPPPPQLSPL